MPAWAGDLRALRVYYNDDTTDLDSVASPYHRRGQAVSDAEVAACIDEAVDAGIDVYVNQPGTGWVPLWTSDVYPAADHFLWFSKADDEPLLGLARYMVEGGDIVAVALKHCRMRGVPMLASFRLNDMHTIYFSGKSPAFTRAHLHDPDVPGWLQSLPYWISRVHMEHPEWRFDAASDRAEDHLWNWAHAEAVAHKLALASELARNYDIDGLELDFMRFPRLFADDLPLIERRRIVEGFLEAVRAALDSGRKGRELALRVPPKLGAFAALGLDLPRLRALGVDRLNLSSNNFTSQDVDFDAIRAAATGLRLTLEMAEAKHFLMHQTPRRPHDDMLLYAAPADDVTTAHLAQSKGCDSISLFNFVYYRSYVDGRGGAGREPPFAVIARLKAPARADCPVQSWFLSTVYFQGFQGFAPMPAQIVPGGSITLRMQVLPPSENGGESALIRYVARQNRSQNSVGEFSVALNGQPLTDPADPNALGLPEDPGLPFRALKIPDGVLRNGENVLTFRLTNGPRAELPLVEVLVACPEAGR